MKRPSAPVLRIETGDVQSITRELSRRIGSHKYDMWFGSAKVNVNGGEVQVAASSPFVASWIGSHYSNELQAVAREALGDAASISITVDPAPARPGDASSLNEASPNGHAAHRATQPALRDGAPPRTLRKSANIGFSRLRRLEDFVIGSSNELAFRAAERLANDPAAKLISPLIVHGDCGVGKTHLLQGICRRFAERTGAPGKVRYVTGEQFTNEYISAVRFNTIEEFRDRIRKLELLAIDDVHFLSNKVRTQHEFQCTIDAIQHLGARIVLASDEHPRNIRKFSPGLVSRLLAGMVVEIKAPDREMRAQLIRRLAEQRRLKLNDAAVEAITSRCAGSVREIEGAINKIAALHEFRTMQQATGDASGVVGLSLVEQVFTEPVWKPAAPVRVASIIEHVCQRLCIGRGDLLSGGRHKRVVLARAVTAYLAKNLIAMSYPEIAAALGRKHHSTIHAAVARIEAQMAACAMVDCGDGPRCEINLRELIDQLRHEITRAAGKS